MIEVSKVPEFCKSNRKPGPTMGWSSHCSECQNYGLLECVPVWFGRLVPMFCCPHIISWRWRQQVLKNVGAIFQTTHHHLLPAPSTMASWSKHWTLTTYSKLSIFCHVWGNGICQSHRKTFRRPNSLLIFTLLKSSTYLYFQFHYFRSCMEVFLEDIVDWWAKHIGYTVCNMITNLSSSMGHYKYNGACVNTDHWQGVKMTNAAASDSREIYRMVG